MNDLFSGSVFFGAFLSLLFYEAGLFCKRKWKHPLANPLLIAIALTIAFLVICRIDYGTYYEGAKYISYLLTPATVCLAVPLYEQISLLKKNARAILAGITAGVLTSVVLILILSLLFGLSHAEYVTLLPKSVTTAIGMAISEKLGGYPSLTAAVIIITGVCGSILAEPVCRLFHIKDPVAKGVGIGTASHAIGTSKAMEMGDVEGAMSGLSIAVAGVITVIMAAVFSGFY
ncbi:MAG: LrgB family protein [Lachnospiraceae bacterium]|nr:LrgB family protein [Lachnospiraceae bacterium]